ncbi:MAG: CoA pyrophosphatase [Chloroflexi bacterium]|nr:CoA pyrophosphatase [Chloroflexota bacterium]
MNTHIRRPHPKQGSASPLTLDLVRRALSLPLPGRAAQVEMAVQPRPGDRAELPNPCPNEAAVLILLYPQGGELCFPLTRRTENVFAHKGQISLPGGAREPGDASFEETARRETTEELGILARRVEILGSLTPLYVPVSRFCIYPYVGHIPRRPTFRPDPIEVAEVIEMPLSLLLDRSARAVETRVIEGISLTIPYYHVSGHRVWGATAMILAEFGALLQAVLDDLNHEDTKSRRVK